MARLEGIGVVTNEDQEDYAFPPPTPLEEAQELIYQAWEEPTKRVRKKLARQALELSADCADAYVILARDNTETLVEELIDYEAGVKAGHGPLGQRCLRRKSPISGASWKRALTCELVAGSAETLWELDRRQEAIDHYREMLSLNEPDNQGLRYTLEPFACWTITVMMN